MIASIIKTITGKKGFLIKIKHGESNSHFKIEGKKYTFSPENKNCKLIADAYNSGSLIKSDLTMLEYAKTVLTCKHHELNIK